MASAIGQARRTVRFHHGLTAVMVLLAVGSVVVGPLGGRAASATPAAAPQVTPNRGVAGVTYQCGPDRAYSCTNGGYQGQDVWGYYGPPHASSNEYGRHNCTLYVAFRLNQDGVAKPNWSDHASGWAATAHRAGVPVDQAPIAGAIAQWNAGHVAYVESVEADAILLTADNYFDQPGPLAGGYTSKVRIERRSPAWPDNFLHFTNPVDADSVAMGLVLDSSGSMRDNDPKNRRIEAGKSYLTATWANDVVGVVDVDSSARVVSEAVNPRRHRAQLIKALDGIDSSGDTDIGAAVRGGCDLLSRSGLQPKKAAILLTDGDGPYADENQCFRSNAWRLYTIGLGAGVKPALLSRIAQETGGRYEHLDSVDNLVCEFQQIRAEVAGAPKSSCLPPDVIQARQTIERAVSVAPRLLQAAFSISWPGSAVDMTLTTPGGRRITGATVAQDVTADSGATYETITVNRPEAGSWRVELYGREVSPGGEPVSTSVAQIPASETDAAPAPGWFSGQAGLQFSTGPDPTRSLAAPAGGFEIGAIGGDAALDVRLGAGQPAQTVGPTLPKDPVLPVGTEASSSATLATRVQQSADHATPSLAGPALRSTLMFGTALLLFAAGLAAWLSAVIVSRARTRTRAG